MTRARIALDLFVIVGLLLGGLGPLMLSVPSPALAQPPDSCPDGMTHYWRLDETSGAVFDDYYDINDASCSAGHCPDFASGVIGGALDFDGTGDYLTVTDDASLDWASDDSFSVELWANLTNCDSRNKVMIGRDDSPSGVHWWLGCSKDTKTTVFNLRSTDRNGVAVEGATPINDGEWHHIVVVRDESADENRLYVDGHLDALPQDFDYAAGFGASTTMGIGYMAYSGTPDYYYDGLLDEVAIYDRALSETEIKSRYYLSRGYCELCETPVRIMPLGDSITVGNASGAVPDDAAHWVSYRKDLWESLDAAGYSVDFVGGETHGDAFDPPFDSDHEGHGGWTDSQIRDSVIGFLTANPADVVLLHIGTNGLDPDPAQVGQILDNIDAVSEDITVILARIVNRKCCTDSSPCSECGTTTTFNDNVQAMAEARIASGDKIVIVDMEDGAGIDYHGQPAGDMNDNLHPYATGYAKMAAVWHDALDDFLPVCGAPSGEVPTITSDPATQAAVGVPYTYDVEADGDPAPSYALTENPSGMTINGTSGLISWTPTTGGGFDVTVQASNSAGTDEQSFTVYVAEVTACPAEMISYWKLDETSGATASDSYDEHDGTLFDGPTWTTAGLVSGALSFDGDNDRVQVPSSADFDIATDGSFSAFTWFKKTSDCGSNAGSQNEVMLSRTYPGQHGSNTWWFGCLTDDHLAVMFFPSSKTSGSDDGIVNSGVVVDDGEWHHGGWVYDGVADELRLYLDGQLQGTDSVALTGAFDSTNPFCIGGYDTDTTCDTYEYAGVLDEVAVFDSALLTEDVQHLYVNGMAAHGYCEAPVIPDPEVENLSLTSSSGSDLTTDDLTCSYDLAGSATTAATAWDEDSAHLMSLYMPMEGGSASALLDYSGAGNHGTAAGDPAWVASGGFDGNGYFDLDGDDYIDAGNAMPADAAYTKAAWVYWIPGNDMNNIISGMKHPGHAFWVTQYPENSGVYLSAGHQDPWREVKDTSVFPANQWVHVAVTYDPAGSGTMVLYRDGVEVDRSTSVTPNNTNGDTQAYVGTYNGSVHFKGYIDDARIYARALSGEQIAALYNSGAGDSNVIVSQETDVGDEWQCHVTPFSASDAGATYPSNVLTILAAGGVPVITSDPLTSAVVGEVYTYDVEADGDPAPSYALTENPSGMTINGTSGLISWTPTTGGAFDVTVQASNSAGMDEQSFTVYVADVTTCPGETIAYYALDESAAPYADLFGGPDATCSNCPISAGGIVDGAQQFTSNQILVPDEDRFDWAAGDSFSIEFWMRRAGAFHQVAIGRDDPATDLHWWVGTWADGTAAFVLRDTSGSGGPFLYGTTNLGDDLWHHVVAVRDGGAGENRIYVDGIEEDSDDASHSYGFGSTVPIELGTLLGGYYYTGALDEVALYGRALSGSEIEQHFVNGMAGHGYCEVEHFAPTITSDPVTEAFVGVLYSYDVEATGYPGPTYALTENPAGMTIDEDTGLISWTPSSTGDYDVTVEASNSEGTDDQSFTIGVGEAPLCPAEMISYWKLDETSGTTFVDYYDGNDGNCSTGHCPGFAAGLVGGALDFDGTSEYLTVADDPSLDWASDESFSIEVWANLTNCDSRNKVMIGRDDRPMPGVHWWLGCSIDTKTAAFNLIGTDDNGVAVKGGTLINDGEWHHIVAVRDEGANENRLYVDGQLDATPQSFDYLAGFEAPTTLGIGYMAYEGTPDYYHDGLLDEIALYHRALTPTEIEQHHSFGRAGLPYCERPPMAPAITSDPVTTAFVGVPYSYDVEATGYPAPTFALSENPADMTIDEDTGVISWTPTAVGDFDVTVEASNSEGSDTQEYTVSVVEAGPCPPDISAYWRLDETTSGTYDDLINIGDDGECATSMPDRTCPSPIPGQVSGGQQFSRSSQTGIDVPVPTDPTEDATFDWGQSDSFSIEFWAKGVPGVTCAGSGVNSNEVIVGRDDEHILHWWFGCANTTGNAHFQLGSRDSGSGDSLVLEGPPINDGAWHHLVGIRDGVSGTNYLYVDGVEVAADSHTYTAGFDSDSAPLNLGWLNLSEGFHFTGELDEVALYDKVLSEYEIRMHYYLGRGYCDGCISPILVMPLGDSITVGNASGVVPDDEAHWVSYRKDLWEGLIAGAYNVDFVGYQSHGYAFDPPFDSDHAGYGGIRDDQIAHLLDTGYNQKTGHQDTPGPYLETYPADVVLLHIGTNGLDASPDDVEDILDEIDEYDEDVTVILARIINRQCCTNSTPCGECTTTTTFNDNVEAMAEVRIAAGDKIILVDMEDGAGIDYRGYPAGDMNDNLHPFATGYAKMAGEWHDALASFLPVCGAPPACYALTLGHTGQGSDPVAEPTHSTGCSVGEYLAGEYIELSGAVPEAGWQIDSWTGTADDTSTASSNAVTMPADAHSVAVNYAEIPPACYALTLGHTGQGSDPVAAPTHSVGCSESEYLAGEYIELSGAVPDSGWQIDSWTGTGYDSGTGATNWLLMPASAHAAGVNYTEIPPTCYALTLGHTGQGSAPVAAPTHSVGCAEGEYLAGEYIELSGAVPEAGWQIDSWTGTADDTSMASSNAMTMPAGAHAAGVNYTEIPSAAIEVVKSAEPTTIYAGESVEYSYQITNIGEVILSDVTLTDDRLGDLSLVPSRVGDDLVALYTFEEGSGSVVHDVSGFGAPLDLTVGDPGHVSWVAGGGLSVDSATIVESGGAASKIIDACQTSNEITIEAWIKPENTTQGGPARIVTLSDGALLRNFTLGQSGAEYDTRLRTTATSDNGIPSLTAGTVSTDLTHVVYTRGAAGVGRLYVNGAQVGTLTGLTGTLSNWDGSYHFGLANEFGAERSWLGEYQLVAIYSRALSSAEVGRNYEARSGVVTLLPGESIEVSVVTTLEEDTTNTATVAGVPPVGDAVMDSDTASVVVETLANSITIVKETEPGGAKGFEFSGDLGSFALDDDGSAVFADLGVGDYEVTEVAPDAWVLMEVVCTGGDIEVIDGGVIIHLDAGENITCTFTNEAAGIGLHSYFFPCACVQ
jgi:lysophospholipase L1-like esterase